MPTDRIRLTREQLHELVWSRPINTVAAEFGISDVGLAKICRRLSVPRPGRGHWAKLAAGRTARPVALPQAKPGMLEHVDLVHRSRTTSPRKPPRAVPRVVVSEGLRASHEATRRIEGLLEKKAFGQPPMHVLRGLNHTVLRVGPDSKHRALLLLDALFKVLHERGHEVCFLALDPSLRYLGYDLHVVVLGETIPISLIEKSGQTPHIVTRQEAELQRRSVFSRPPAYDRFTTGVLAIELQRGRYGTRARYADGKGKRLEDRIGHVVLAIEDLAEEERAQRAARAIATEEAEVKRRRAEAEGRQREHIVALGHDLLQMAGRWAEATRMHAFLDAYEQRLAQEEKTEAELAWIEWARSFAMQRDPLTKLNIVAKKLTT